MNRMFGNLKDAGQPEMSLSEEQIRKYRTDPEFHAWVDKIASLVINKEVSIQELRDALGVADYRVKEINLCRPTRTNPVRVENTKKA